jgi:hypothetical protein
VFHTKAAARGWFASPVSKATKIVADEAGSWNGLEARFQGDRIDQSQPDGLDGIRSNGAESFFSHLRRAEIWHHHHTAGTYLVSYAQEVAWREDHRRVANRRPGPGPGFTGGGRAYLGALVRVLAAGG